MAAQIAIIHGWSDSSKSFRDLRDYLTRNGRKATELWLGDYISMDDDVRIEDVAKRMDQVIRASIASGELTKPFDLIVHSTGGLVAREWVMTFHPGGDTCPAKRIVMLAPANFGSKLASTGKSFIGRVLKGWNNWFHTGRQMLNDLELASPYQWRLAQRDLLDPAGGTDGPFRPGGIWPFVIAGTQGYTDGLRRIVNENGSDGTVRVPAANLNTVGMTIDFTTSGTKPAVRAWSSRVGFAQIPFAVMPARNHSTIVHPEIAPEGGEDDLGAMILEALACDSDRTYAAIAQRWAARTDAAGQLADGSGDAAFHQYMQAVVRVVDDHGRPVDDYFLEFFDPRRSGGRSDNDDDTVFFQREVLEDVHVNGTTASHRCLYLDRTDLLRRFYQPKLAKEIALSISAAPIGENIRFFDKDQKGAKGSVVIHKESLDAGERLGGARFYRNTTHLIEIVIPRQPIDRVFRLSR